MFHSTFLSPTVIATIPLRLRAFESATLSRRINAVKENGLGRLGERMKDPTTQDGEDGARVSGNPGVVVA